MITLDQRNAALAKVIDTMCLHPRFNYVVSNCTYRQLFDRKRTAKSTELNRIQCMSVDWKAPYSSVWLAMWASSSNITDFEYLELKPLAIELDNTRTSELGMINSSKYKWYLQKAKSITEPV